MRYCYECVYWDRNTEFCEQKKVGKDAYDSCQEFSTTKDKKPGRIIEVGKGGKVVGMPMRCNRCKFYVKRVCNCNQSSFNGHEMRPTDWCKHFIYWRRG